MKDLLLLPLLWQYFLPMNTITFKKAVAGAMFLSAFVAVPTFAATASSTASVHINKNGVVQVVGAEVTGISGNVISAVTRFKNNVMSWVFTTNASTTIAANNAIGAALSDIQIGDKLHVKGQLSTLASSTVVTAARIRDVSSMQSWKVKEGTVQSVNASSNSFVMKKGDKLITVAGNASTTITPVATTTLTIPTIPLNSKVVVTGRLSADGTSLLASKIIVLPANLKKEANRGMLHGLKLGWPHNKNH